MFVSQNRFLPESLLSLFGSFWLFLPLGASGDQSVSLGRLWGAKVGQDRPKMAQDGARMAQDGARMAQDGARKALGRLWGDFRSQDEPRWSLWEVLGRE